MLGFWKKQQPVHTDPVKALAAGDLDRALVLFREQARRDPSRATTYLRKAGDVLQQAGRPREAAAEYLAAARLYEREGKMGQVLALYRAVLRIDPQNDDVRARLADIAADTGPTGPRPGAPAAAVPAEQSPAETIRTRLRTVVPLFSLFERDELTSILEVMNNHAFRAGQKVFEQGQSGDSLYILVQGEILLSVRGSEDEAVEIERLRDTGVFGEVSALTRAPRNMTAQCVTACEVLELTHDYIEAVAIAQPRVWDVLEQFRRTRQIPVGV